MEKSNDIEAFYETISDKKDFEKFLLLLKEDYTRNKHVWENDNLESFLDGLYGYNYDTTEEGAKVQPTWRMFADMLLAARIYE